MLNTVWGLVQHGQIQLLENVTLPEGAKVLVTLVSDEDSEFWTDASQSVASAIWDNPEDDVYGELLKE